METLYSGGIGTSTKYRRYGYQVPTAVPRTVGTRMIIREWIREDIGTEEGDIPQGDEILSGARSAGIGAAAYSRQGYSYAANDTTIALLGLLNINQRELRSSYLGVTLGSGAVFTVVVASLYMHARIQRRVRTLV